MTQDKTMSEQPVLGPVGQISRMVRDIAEAVAFYRDALGGGAASGAPACGRDGRVDGVFHDPEGRALGLMAQVKGG